jgi:hypothetical protein
MSLGEASAKRSVGGKEIESADLARKTSGMPFHPIPFQGVN